MRQIRITTANFCPPSEDDCYLAPDDPIHELKKASMMGGLGSELAISKYLDSQPSIIVGSDKGKIAREQGIQPGTTEWFTHYFGTGSSNWKSL